MPLGLTQNERRNHTLSLSETHLFTPRIVNEARGGFNRVPWLRRSNDTLRQFLQNIGFNDADIQAYGAVVAPSALDTYGHPSISFGSTYAALGNGGRNTYRPLDQNLLTFGDTLTWMKGTHTPEVRRRLRAQRGRRRLHQRPRQSARAHQLHRAPTPIRWSRFLLGMPANTVQYVNSFRPPMDVYNWETGFFVQDDFKVTPRLTRESRTALRDHHAVHREQRPAGELRSELTCSANGQKGRFVVPSEKTLAVMDPRYIELRRRDRGPRPACRESLVQTDNNNLAPRLGVAWRLTDKTVLRGGYGFFYPTSAAQGIRDPLATNSFQVGLTRRPTAAAPLQGWPGFDHGISPMSGGVADAAERLRHRQLGAVRPAAAAHPAMERHLRAGDRLEHGRPPVVSRIVHERPD